MVLGMKKETKWFLTDMFWGMLAGLFFVVVISAIILLVSGCHVEFVGNTPAKKCTWRECKFTKTKPVCGETQRGDSRALVEFQLESKTGIVEYSCEAN